MARIYVGNLPLDIRERDLEDLFWKYGRIRDLNLKNPARPPAFAFVSFERYEDAEDAIRGRGQILLKRRFFILCHQRHILIDGRAD